MRSVNSICYFNRASAPCMRTTTGPASPHVSYASMTPSCVWQRRAASFDMLQAYTRYPAVLRSVVRRCCGVCTLCTAHDDRALRQARFRSKHLSQEGRQANFSTSQVFQLRPRQDGCCGIPQLSGDEKCIGQQTTSKSHVHYRRLLVQRSRRR